MHISCEYWNHSIASSISWLKCLFVCSLTSAPCCRRRTKISSFLLSYAREGKVFNKLDIFCFCWKKKKEKKKRKKEKKKKRRKAKQTFQSGNRTCNWVVSIFTGNMQFLLHFIEVVTCHGVQIIEASLKSLSPTQAANIKIFFVQSPKYHEISASAYLWHKFRFL